MPRNPSVLCNSVLVMIQPPGQQAWETSLPKSSSWYWIPFVSIFPWRCRGRPCGLCAAGCNWRRVPGSFDHASNLTLWKIDYFVLPLLQTCEYIKINHRWRWFAIDMKCIMAGKRNLIHRKLPTTTCHSEMCKKPQLHRPTFPLLFMPLIVGQMSTVLLQIHSLGLSLRSHWIISF